MAFPWGGLYRRKELAIGARPCDNLLRKYGYLPEPTLPPTPRVDQPWQNEEGDWWTKEKECAWPKEEAPLPPWKEKEEPRPVKNPEYWPEYDGDAWPEKRDKSWKAERFPFQSPMEGKPVFEKHQPVEPPPSWLLERKHEPLDSGPSWLLEKGKRERFRRSLSVMAGSIKKSSKKKRARSRIRTPSPPRTNRIEKKAYVIGERIDWC